MRATPPHKKRKTPVKPIKKKKKNSKEIIIQYMKRTINTIPWPLNVK